MGHLVIPEKRKLAADRKEERSKNSLQKMVQHSSLRRYGLGLLIVLVFLAFQWGAWLYAEDQRILPDQVPGAGPVLKVARHHNADASLSPPFLDKINKYWLVGGRAQIRNFGHVRLTSRGQPRQHGVLLSNGIGDNTIDDFEVVVAFSIYSEPDKQQQHHKQLLGDGMCIAITSEKEFISQDLHSSYAKRQYMLNSGGVVADNRDLMGLPGNMPGLALVVDTFRNSRKTVVQAPFLSILLNKDPETHRYDSESDGSESTGSVLSSPPQIKLKRSVVQGQKARLRIIYLESIGFLKIDIDYSGNGHWLELFKQATGVMLPKNKKTGQRYIGIAGANGELTETIDIFSVDTYEFEWDDRDGGHDGESDGVHEGDSFSRAEEMQLFLAREFGERVSMEEDEFTKWKLLKYQQYIEGTESGSVGDLSPRARSKPKAGLFQRAFKWAFILFILYFASVYVRVVVKRIRKRALKRRHNTAGLLG